MKRKSDKHKKRGARLGQHLLTNSGIAFAVAAAAGIRANDRVLEIGPGTGILTKEILSLGAKVTAVEKDPAMVAVLEERFVHEIKEKRLEIREGDARELTPDNLFPKGEYKVAANIPYYITGELIRECLTAKNQPVSVALLVQKEVAQRIVGDPERSRGTRSKKESVLSLSVKVYGAPKYVKTVSKGSFNPAPSVDSAILAIEHISRKNFQHISEKRFFEIIKAGFAQKRKTLGGNLKKVFGERALSALAACGISEKIRAEDVPLPKWLALAKKI